MRLRLITIPLMIALCLPAFAEKVILGKLGQALAQTPIFSRPTTRARVYYKVKPYEYLVLQSANNDKYFKVLLENGSYGYVSSEAVARLPYNVTADRNSPMRDIGSVSSRSRAALASYSLNYEGTPYVWGGNDPQRGIDCSGFVKYLYGKIGINLPRTAAQQVHVGQRITRLEDLKAGDRLYFWSSKRNMIGHTGMYLGNGYFVHSSTNHHGVATDYLATPKWLNMLVAARR